MTDDIPGRASLGQVRVAFGDGSGLVQLTRIGFCIWLGQVSRIKEAHQELEKLRLRLMAMLLFIILYSRL